MRRTLTLLAACAAALVPAAPSAFADSPPASLRLVKCSVADRELVVRGRMSQVAGSERMAMRFTLLERFGTSAYTVVRAPGLGVWRRSRPDVGEFAYRQAVKGLPAGAVHRMRVDFRWYDAGGAPIEALRRVSARCDGFESLP